MELSVANYNVRATGHVERLSKELGIATSKEDEVQSLVDGKKESISSFLAKCVEYADLSIQRKLEGRF